MDGTQPRAKTRWLIAMAVAWGIAGATGPTLAFSGSYAVSLQRLAEDLETCQSRGSCPRSLVEFDGLRVIDGYVVDPEDGDIVLIGRRDDALPPLLVEDFVVALRNAWLRYAERQGNSILYSHPGCSIDPDPLVMRELDGIGSQVLSGDREQEQEWERVCRKPQQVRVLGMPFHSHFGKVMVQADYDMKGQVDGSDPLDIPGLESLVARTLEQIREDIEANRPVSVAASSMNRFWFFPGDNVWEEDEGVVWIRESPVTLLSNQMFVDASNQLVDASGRDLLAEEFAASFTRHFDELADRRPIYRQLEGLFRFVALAQIFKARVRASSAEATLDYYLDTFPVAHTEVPTELPGRAHADGFELRRVVANGIETVSMRLPSCGGVSIDIKADEDSFRPGGEELRQLRDRVLSGKRRGGVGWQVPGSTAQPGSTKPRRTEDSRRSEDNVFGVRKARDGVDLVHPEGGTEFFSLRDRDQLVEVVTEWSSAERIYLDLEGFSAEEATVFETDFRLGLDWAEGDATLVVVRDANELLTRPVRFAEVSEPRRIGVGEYEGWWQNTVYLVQEVGGTLQELALEIRARTLELLEFLLHKIQVLLQTGPMSSSRLIDQAIRETRRDFRGSFQEGDIELRIHHETGRCRIVEQRPPARERMPT